MLAFVAGEKQPFFALLLHSSSTDLPGALRQHEVSVSNIHSDHTSGQNMISRVRRIYNDGMAKRTISSTNGLWNPSKD